MGKIHCGWGLVGIMILGLGGCSSSPIHATSMAAGPGVWVEDPNSGLSYCVSNESSKGPAPTCFPAHKADERITMATASAAVPPPISSPGNVTPARTSEATPEPEHPAAAKEGKHLN